MSIGVSAKTSSPVASSKLLHFAIITAGGTAPHCRNLSKNQQ